MTPTSSFAVGHTRTINTTIPLAGGGTLGSDLTLSLRSASAVDGGGISVAEWVRLNDLGNNFVTSSRTLTTTAPIDGGGALTANRTLTLRSASAVDAGGMSPSDFTKLSGIPSNADSTFNALGAATASFSINSQIINNVGAPTAGVHAATRGWVESITGSLLITSASFATAPVFTGIITVGVAANSTGYSVVAFNAAQSGTICAFTSSGAATIAEIRSGLGAAIVAANVGLSASAIDGQATLSVDRLGLKVLHTTPGTYFNLHCFDTRLGCGMITNQRRFTFGAGSTTSVETSVYPGLSGSVFQTAQPLVTWPGLWDANTSDRLSWNVIQGIRSYMGLTSVELPDGEWEIEGSFSAGTDAGGQSLVVWRSPFGPNETSTGAHRDNSFSISAADANAAPNYDRFRTDGFGRMWIRKVVANVADYLALHAFTMERKG